MMLNAFSKILDWLENLVRILFFLLDKIVYKLIAMVYDLLLDIANANIFDENFFTMLSKKIYVILGVVMLFKLSFNVISYIINPDDFVDKNKGFGKIITLILISLSLLVVTPWIFNKARDVQIIVLNNNLIERFLLDDTGVTEITDPGNYMANTTFQAFCKGGTYPSGDIFAIDINEKSGDEYVWDYMYLVSTVVGVCIVLLLVVMCFDVAVRNVKLGFLQMLAPVPIISRMDPKGQGVFDKWVKACTNTYLDLFIRLLGISLAVLVISYVDELKLEGNSILVKVFIIIGVLLFAKQLPQLISDLFGVKLDGKFTMNPIKKFRDVPLASAAVGGLAGAGMGALSNFNAHRQLGHGVGRSLLGAGGGIFAGAGRGFKGGIHDDGKGSIFKYGQDAARKGAQNIYKNEGTTFGGRTIAKMQQGLGLDTGAEKMDKSIKDYESLAGNIESIFKRANSEMRKANFTFNDMDGATIDMNQFKQQEEKLNALKNMDTSRMSVADLDNHTKEIVRLSQYIGKTEKLAEQAFVDKTRAREFGDKTDAQIYAQLANVEKAVSSSTDAIIRSVNTTTGAGLKDGKDAVTNEKVKVQNSEEYVRAKKVQAATSSKK